jgi:hypothetical protein
MSLSLPEDLGEFTDDYYRLTTGSGVYVLELSKPDHPTAAWDAEYESRADWFEDWRDAATVYYVGAAKCVLSRLEDHKQSDVRLTALTRVCTVKSLENVHWYDSVDEAFLKESQHAIDLNQETGDATFVHSN